MPANTGTNHTAILTSTTAGRHGILGIGGYYSGLDFSPFRLSRKYGMAKACTFQHRHLQVPTLFNVYKQQNPNLKTAFITGKTWLGSIIPDEDCNVTIYPGNTAESCGAHKENPWYVNESYGYILAGLAHPEDNELFPRVYIPSISEGSYATPPGAIGLGAVGFDADKLPSDQWIMDQTLQCISQDDPDLMYIVLMNMDLAGHSYGSFLKADDPYGVSDENLSPFRNPLATKDQLFITDQQIQRIISHLYTKGTLDESRIIITSDHGMNTMKAMYSQESRQEIINWMTMHLDALHDPSSYEFIQPMETKEHLYVDIRAILAQHGIHMRASPDKFMERYKPDGDYDWCISEGPNGYIYNASPEIQQQIKTLLQDYTIEENGYSIYPIWKVLIQSDQDDAVNEYTGEIFQLGKGDYEDVIWPSVMVFCKPHYMIPMYHDQLQSALMPLMLQLQLPGFIDIKTAMGAHGTYLEQHVPLIISSPSESTIPHDTINGSQVSLLDISATICQLNGWPQPSTFQGVVLFS